LVAPVAGSKARSAPRWVPPTCAITRPLSKIGDIAVPNSGGGPNSLS
jgi:hypothetical protein